MKKLLGILVFINLGLCIFGTEITFTTSAGNYNIAERETLTENASVNKKFFGNYAGSLNVKSEISPVLSVLTEIGRDEILQNYAGAELVLNLNSISFSAGPWFGLYNLAKPKAKESLDLLQPGFALGLETGIPGMITGFCKTNFTFSTGEQVEYSLSHRKNLLGVKFWLPNVICTVQMEQKTTESSLGSGSIRKHMITTTGFYADVFSKGLPFRVLLTLAYQELENRYIEATPVDPEKDTLGTIITGVDFTIQATKNFSFVIGFEGGVYSFYRDKRDDSTCSGFFPFEARLGCSYFIPQN